LGRGERRRARRIPNRLAALLAVAGLARIGWELAASGAAGPAAADLALAAAVFGAGALLFGLGVFGGGDAKLLAAGALWFGTEAAWSFLLGTAVAGGVLALGFLVWFAIPRGGVAVRPSLPYGVAIAAGACWRRCRRFERGGGRSGGAVEELDARRLRRPVADADLAGLPADDLKLETLRRTWKPRSSAAPRPRRCRGGCSRSRHGRCARRSARGEAPFPASVSGVPLA
jgi:prepilin peptidase CpaA